MFNLIHKEEYLGLTIEIIEYDYGETEMTIRSGDSFFLASEARPTAKWSEEYQKSLLEYWKEQIDYGFIWERYSMKITSNNNTYEINRTDFIAAIDRNIMSELEWQEGITSYDQYVNVKCKNDQVVAIECYSGYVYQRK